MAKDNEIIRELKQKFNDSLAELQEKYPEITYRPRSKDPNGTKANDISVEIYGKIAVILHADDNFPNGVIYTENLSIEDKNNAILVEGWAADPDPDSIYTKYRFRPKWTGSRWVKYFDSYEKFVFEIETIICRTLGVALPKLDEGINTPLPPKAMSDDGFVIVCPRCDNKFQHADRCPECGQKILYSNTEEFELDEALSAREKVRKCVLKMKAEGLSISSENYEDSSPYAILSGKTSIGYRKGEGIVLYCAKDGIDRDSISAALNKEVLPNAEPTRPYKIVLMDGEFLQAIHILKQNDKNV